MVNTALNTFLAVLKTSIITILTHISAKIRATIEGAIKYTKKGVEKQHDKEVKKADEVKEVYNEIDRRSQANRDTGASGAIKRLHELSSSDRKDTK